MAGPAHGRIRLDTLIADSASGAAMVLVVVSWVLGAFIGGWVAAKVAREHPLFAALMIGVLVLAGVVANNTMIPHPLWMTVLGVLLPLPAAWLGARMARRPATATP